MDFVLPARPVRMQLCSGRGHYDAVIAAVLRARCSVWVATANLKEMMVEERRGAGGRGRFRSILEVFDELARAGVELRILHAKLPSGPFRERFDRLPRLYQGGVELRECPRVHLKTVIVDGRVCYLGSANWTGAGLGAKGEGRRNFEVGVITEDEGIIDAVQELYERIWTGRECGACRLRKDGCEAPLDLPIGRLVRDGRGPAATSSAVRADEVTDEADSSESATATRRPASAAKSTKKSSAAVKSTKKSSAMRSTKRSSAATSSAAVKSTSRAVKSTDEPIAVKSSAPVKSTSSAVKPAKKSNAVKSTKPERSTS